MLHIGFDAKRLFNNFTGLGNYSRSLVSGIKQFYPNNKLYLFTPDTKNKPDTNPFFSKNYHLIKPQKGSKNWWRTATCTKDIVKNKLDIFHGLSHELPIGIQKTGVKSIVTIHDLIYLTYPNDFSIIDRNIYNLKFKSACKTADKIIAVSQSTKNDLIRFYQLNPDKIEVCYQTCNEHFKAQLQKQTLIEISKTYKLPKNFMLYVGSVIARKNLLGIVKAMHLLKPDNKIPLVVVGDGNAYLKKVKAYIHNHQLEKEIIFIKPKHYTHLPAIYQLADLFIYPSQYEGFGIPIIEALWSKTPVITSNLSSLPEAAGPGAFYCDPANPESIFTGITAILTDQEYKQNLINDGFAYVQKFSTHETTKSVMGVYLDLIQ